MPPLPEFDLAAALQRLEGLDVDDIVKRQIGDSLKAASRGGESLEFALNNLPKERLEIVMQTAKSFRAISRGVARRGKKALQDMSQEEWDALVRKANESTD